MTNEIRITVVGTGYVGLVSGTCFAELGFKVICIDKDKHKIAQLNAHHIPIYEPTLEELAKKHARTQRLTFSTDLKSALEISDVIFIAVGTPPSPIDGRADLSYIEAVAKELSTLITDYKVIVIKSTVPVGTGQRMKKMIQSLNPNAQFDIVSNPEFLREGSAVYDFMQPDRIIVGVESERSKNIMTKLYSHFTKQNTPILYTDIESSELIKYAANCFLATKIAFINEMANLCEKTFANIDYVIQGLGLDKRIGPGYLQVGPGFGGSCFPKDSLALVSAAREVQSPLNIIEAVVKSNDLRKQQMVDKIIKACGGSVRGKRIAILGVAFKANTDDIRDSSALVIIQGLQLGGAHITIYDPAAMGTAQKVLSGIEWAQNAGEAMRGKDAVVIVTEWEEFKELDFHVTGLAQPLVIDLRNLYDCQTLSEKGIRYYSIGRPVMPIQSLEEDITNLATTEMCE